MQKVDVQKSSNQNEVKQ